MQTIADLHFSQPNRLEVENSPFPKEVRIAIPSAMKLMVQENEVVTEGDVLAKGNQDYEYVYASLSGKITKIKKTKKETSIQIQFEGSIKNWFSSENTPNLQTLKQSGIYIKNVFYEGFLWPYLQNIAGKNLIVLTGQMDTHSYHNEALFLQKEKEILTSLSYLKDFCQIAHVDLFFPYPLKSLKQSPWLTVHRHSNLYPMSHPLILAKKLYGKEINMFNWRDSQFFVLDAQNLISIYENLFFHKPFVDSFTTLGGKNFKHSGVYRIRIGSYLLELLRSIGFYEQEKAFNVGGPFLGDILMDAKNLCYHGYESSFFSLMEEEISESNKQYACTYCDHCSRSCPMNLNPHFLRQSILHEQSRLAFHEGLFDCILCGLCDFVCPSIIPMRDLFKEAQKKYLELYKREKK